MSEQHPRFARAQIEALQAQVRELQAARHIEYGGGGPHDPGMGARVAKLEADVSHIQSDVSEIKTDIRDLRKAMETDFRLLFGALIATALGLATIMAKGFHWF